jgi:hypothetical protein
MPHVRRRLETAFAADADVVRSALATSLDLEPEPDGTLTGTLSGTTGLSLRVTVLASETGSYTAKSDAKRFQGVPKV